MGILFAILIFSFLIFIHEFGHFITAKLSGVQVNEFAIFMGPAIWKKQIGETLYSIRCIPIGGYCAMEGEDTDSDNPRAFGRAAWWKRLMILVAGAAMNFIVGVLLTAIVLSCATAYVTPQIATVESWSTLNCENGLRAGDTVLEVNGKDVDVYQDFILATMALEDGNYDILVERNGQQLLLEDVPMVRQKRDDSGTLYYGISFRIAETTAASVPGRIWPTAMSHVDSVIMGLKMLVTGQVSVTEMSGPVGIVDMMSDTAASADSTAGAVLSMLDIGALIAINLAVMNLLPIPALDGGRVVALLLTTGIEKVTGKKLNPKYEGYIHAAGMILLLGLMAVIMLKDIIFVFK